MTRYLLELGHRDIGFVKGGPAHSASAKRYDGNLGALAAACVAATPPFVRQGDFSSRSGLAVGEELLARPELPSAIFASNDDTALGVLISAIKRGIAVTERLSIAGFDDAPTSRAACRS